MLDRGGVVDPGPVRTRYGEGCWDSARADDDGLTGDLHVALGRVDDDGARCGEARCPVDDGHVVEIGEHPVVGGVELLDESVTAGDRVGEVGSGVVPLPSGLRRDHEVLRRHAGDVDARAAVHGR